MTFKPNTIYCGDCKDVLRHFPEYSIDLIYLDPPFFSNRHFEVIWKDGYELRSFEDRWKGGIHNYIGWMEERLWLCQRTLKPNGSIFLHCDWHAGHYLKVLLDKIFGYERFLNEIVWCFETSGKAKTHFSRKHNTIFWYSKGEEYTFNAKAVSIPRKPGKHMRMVLMSMEGSMKKRQIQKQVRYIDGILTKVGFLLIIGRIFNLSIGKQRRDWVIQRKNRRHYWIE